MDKVIRVLCYGDSNTYGHIPAEGGRYDRHTRWPGRLQELLGESWHVIEEGLNGRTTAFEDEFVPGRCGLDVIGEVVQGHDPFDILIIMLGSNDCKRRFRASAEMITDGLEQVLEKARDCAPGSFSILVVAPASMTMRVTSADFGSEFDETSVNISKELAGRYEELAQKLHCDFLDASRVTQVSTTDGLHLDADGHKALAKAVCEYLLTKEM